jgi:hypothetical protein
MVDDTPTAKVVALSPPGEGEDQVHTETIPDPGGDPPSAYTSAPNFTGKQGIQRRTSIIARRPKDYCKSLFSTAAKVGMVTLINAKRADEIGDNLHLILPEIARNDELMCDVDGAYEAFGIPFIDRHSIPHMWFLRQYQNDGREISSFATAVEAAEFAENHWTLIRFVAGRWEHHKHRNPDKIHAEWPKALVTFDDWIENTLPGRIIRKSDHPILEAARGKL